MKFTSATVALLAGNQVVASNHLGNRLIRHPRQIGEIRRFSQLEEMMEFYSDDFDSRKYWTYGCNCFLLGDRPMSDPGMGQPVDALDGLCKQYKDCLKCARMEHGESCLGEMVKYGFLTDDQTNSVECTNNVNSCKRSICECDKMFASQHKAKSVVFDNQYHAFWAQLNGYPAWNPKEDEQLCAKGTARGVSDIQCCRKTDKAGPFTLYNAFNKACCANGHVVTDSSQC